MVRKHKRKKMSKGFLKVAEDILKNIDNYSGSQKEFYLSVYSLFL